jgi:hypothetical protein
MALNPDLAPKSVAERSTASLAMELVVLRAMRVKPLHPFAMSMMKVSAQESVAGRAARVCLKPWFDQFCVSGEVGAAVAASKAKGVALALAIFDFSEECITDPKTRLVTEAKYREALEHSDVSFIAAKLSGVCPLKVLESGDASHPDFVAAMESMERVVVTAQRLGNVVVFDAENFLAEGLIEKAALSFAKRFPKNVMMTVQATRRDSVARLLGWLKDMPEGAELMVKLVKGAYKDDRKNFLDIFFDTFDGTHENYLQLMQMGVDHPNLVLLPCTHNIGLIKEAKEKGFKTVGNLSGMNIVKAVSEELGEALYVIYHTDFPKLVEYMMRRFYEHGEALEPRRELLLRAALWDRMQKTFGFLDKGSDA